MLKVIASLMAVLLLGLGAACTTTSTAPVDAHLSGHWVLDKLASDDPDVKISAAISSADSKLRRRLASAGYDQYGPDQTGNGGGRGRRDGGSGGNPSGGSSGGDAELNGDEFSATGFIGPDFHELRSRLRLVMTAPQSLVIDTQPDSVRLAPDNLPARDYSAGDEFVRMDEYGTARIDTKWSGATFILRARYANHATVTERYKADLPAGTLAVVRDVTDPVVGKLEVRSTYRH
jgi:hypothetical protein